MTALVWTASLLLFCVVGLSVWKLAGIAEMDLAARLSIAFTCGLVIVTVLMWGESALGIPWSFWTLGIPLAVAAAVSVAAARRRSSPARTWPRATALAFGAVAAIMIYGAATARMTIGDLLYFWGPKAVHFFHARAIDVDFLRWPHHYLMHPDYPPLVPLTWAASSFVAGRFSYWGAVWGAALVMIAAAAAFRGFAAPVLGARKSAAFATLLLAILTLGATAGSMAGGGDPYLLLFEVVALSALTFPESRGSRVVAAVALAGAVLTKVEGAAFVAAVVMALLLVRRFRAVAVALPAFALLACWIGYAHHHELIDSYGRADRQLHPGNLMLVLSNAANQLSYGAFYLPWLGALAPLFAGRSFRRAALPFLVGLASIAYTTYFYMNEADPVWWIRSSVERVMMTTLISFVVATAAASE